MVPHQPKLMLVLCKLHEIASRHLSLPNLLGRNRLGHGGIHPLHPTIRIKEPVVSLKVADITQSFGSYLYLPAWGFSFSQFRRFHHQHLSRCSDKPKILRRIDEEITNSLPDAHRSQQPLDIPHVGILRQIEHEKLSQFLDPYSLPGIHIRRG